MRDKKMLNVERIVVVLHVGYLKVSKIHLFEITKFAMYL